MHQDASAWSFRLDTKRICGAFLLFHLAMKTSPANCVAGHLGCLVAESSPCCAQLLLGQIDIDASGTIDYEEFLAATVNLSQLEKEENMYRAFAHFDTDNSGYITEDRAGGRAQGAGALWHCSKRLLEKEDPYTCMCCLEMFLSMRWPERSRAQA